MPELYNLKSNLHKNKYLRPLMHKTSELISNVDDIRNMYK